MLLLFPFFVNFLSFPILRVKIRLKICVTARHLKFGIVINNKYLFLGLTHKIIYPVFLLSYLEC